MANAYAFIRIFNPLLVLFMSFKSLLLFTLGTNTGFGNLSLDYFCFKIFVFHDRISPFRFIPPRREYPSRTHPQREILSLQKQFTKTILSIPSSIFAENMGQPQKQQVPKLSPAIRYDRPRPDQIYSTQGRRYYRRSKMSCCLAKFFDN